MSNEIDIMRVQLDRLTQRVKVLEKSIRPLTALEGVDSQFLSDQGAVSLCAQNAGSTLAVITGPSRTREATEARRMVAKLLHERLHWSPARIGRNLNRTDKGIRRLLSAR